MSQYSDSTAGIKASIHILYNTEDPALLTSADLSGPYDADEEYEGERVLSDAAIDLLASWLAGEGWHR